MEHSELQDNKTTRTFAGLKETTAVHVDRLSTRTSQLVPEVCQTHILECYFLPKTSCFDLLCSKKGFLSPLPLLS